MDVLLAPTVSIISIFSPNFFFLKMCVLWISSRKRRVKWNLKDKSINVCLAFKSWGVDHIVSDWTFSIQKIYSYIVSWVDLCLMWARFMLWKLVIFWRFHISYSVITNFRILDFSTLLWSDRSMFSDETQFQQDLERQKMLLIFFFFLSYIPNFRKDQYGWNDLYFL